MPLSVLPCNVSGNNPWLILPYLWYPPPTGRYPPIKPLNSRGD